MAIGITLEDCVNINCTFPGSRLKIFARSGFNVKVHMFEAHISLTESIAFVADH